MNTPRRTKSARLSEAREKELADIFASALINLNAANAAILDGIYDGTHAVFITDRAARTHYGIDLGFANVDDIEAIFIDRTKATYVANAIDPSVGLQVAVVDPATPRVIPMLMLFGGDGVYVKPGRLLTADEVSAAQPTDATATEHSPAPEASPSDPTP